MLGILRVSLGIVFLAFGIGKFQNDYWARTMESMPFVQKFPWSAHYSVLGVGVLEVLTATSLIIGFFWRYAAFMAATMLLGILILVQFQEVRDIALLGMALYLALYKKEK